MVAERRFAMMWNRHCSLAALCAAASLLALPAFADDGGAEAAMTAPAAGPFQVPNAAQRPSYLDLTVSSTNRVWFETTNGGVHEFDCTFTLSISGSPGDTFISGTTSSPYYTSINMPPGTTFQRVPNPALSATARAYYAWGPPPTVYANHTAGTLSRLDVSGAAGALYKKTASQAFTLQP
jgi:hypothetical protein